MSLSRCKFPSTISTISKFSGLQGVTLTRSYGSFIRPINKLNGFTQSNQVLVLASTRSREEHRRFYSDFGQIPKQKKFNVLFPYAFIAGGSILSFLLYTKEPNFNTLEIRSDDLHHNFVIHEPKVELDYVVSSLWRRVVAFLIDNTLISVLFQAIHVLLAGKYEAIGVPLAACGSFAYEVLSYVHADGRTLGKYLTNIQVSTDDGTPITYGVAIKYTLTKLLNIFFMADALYGAFDVSGQKKCIHNVFSRTVVLQALPHPSVKPFPLPINAAQPGTPQQDINQASVPATRR